MKLCLRVLSYRYLWGATYASWPVIQLAQRRRCWRGLRVQLINSARQAGGGMTRVT
jgi:hypothetical protein